MSFIPVRSCQMGQPEAVLLSNTCSIALSTQQGFIMYEKWWATQLDAVVHVWSLTLSIILFKTMISTGYLLASGTVTVMFCCHTTARLR